MLPTTLQAQRERARAAAQMLALSSAVEPQAAERNRTARQTPSDKTGTKPPAGAAQQAGRDATARNDSGVAVTLRRDSGAPDQRASRPDPDSASGKTDSGEGGFSVIARTETTVLVRQGNSVKHYALGEVLPDGRKVTEQDLRAPVR